MATTTVITAAGTGSAMKAEIPNLLNLYNAGANDNRIQSISTPQNTGTSGGTPWLPLGISAGTSVNFGLNTYAAKYSSFIQKSDGNIGLIINSYNTQDSSTLSTHSLYVNGTAFCTSGTWSGSDISFKENVVPVTNAVELVNQLNPVCFKWKADNALNVSGNSVGFIAQEVQNVLDAVSYKDKVVADGGPNGTLTLNETRLIPILTAAIKELSAEVSALKAKLAN